MSIVKTTQKSTFGHIRRGAPFAATVTLYTRSDGKEDPKEYLFYKTGQNKAATIDRKTFVHFVAGSKITLCNMPQK